MESKSGRVLPAFPLATVVAEIADKLVANDWMRCATADETSHYFIIGFKAYQSEATGGVDHMSLALPGTRSVSPFGQAQVDAQVAAARPADFYVRHAIAKLVSFGVDQKQLREFALGEIKDLSFLSGHIGQPGSDSFQAFSELLEAMLLGKAEEPELTEGERRAQIDVAVQKIYLKQLAVLYKHVVERAALLEPLTFSDPQLNEASRCYLYGFFRATAVLCGSALEQNLKNALKTAETNQSPTKRVADSGATRGFFNTLVDQADSLGLLGPREQFREEPRLTQYSRRVFEKRTAVVHNGHIPLSEEASELLTMTREVVEFLRTASGGRK